MATKDVLALSDNAFACERLLQKKSKSEVLSSILWVNGKEVPVRKDSVETVMSQHQCTLCRMAHCVWENLQGLEMEEGDLAFMQIVPCTSFLQKEV